MYYVHHVTCLLRVLQIQTLVEHKGDLPHVILVQSLLAKS